MFKLVISNSFQKWVGLQRKRIVNQFEKHCKKNIGRSKSDLHLLTGTTHEVAAIQFTSLGLFPEEHAATALGGNAFSFAKCGHIARSGRRFLGASRTPCDERRDVLQADVGSLRFIYFSCNNLALIEHLFVELAYILPKGSANNGRKAQRCKNSNSHFLSL
jgi:hypothetical protein